MNYRTYKFYSRSTHTSDTTIVHDINMQDPISSIILGFEFYHTGYAYQLAPVSCVKKIELIDGSDVLWSLDGYEAEALDWYNNNGNLRSNWNVQSTGGTVSRYVGIHFGRYLWDPEYAFDPTKFVNPQLRVSLDIDAASSTGSTIYLTMWANMFDEAPTNLKGFFSCKELKQWTMADNVHEYTDLPLDHVYESLYMRAYLSETAPNSCLENIKISEDQDKRVPINNGGQEILRNCLGEYGEVMENIIVAPHTVARECWVTPTERVFGMSQPWTATAYDAGGTCYGGDGGNLAHIVKSASENHQIRVVGATPHSTYKIPFGIKMQPETYYDVRHLGSLRADVEGAAAAQGFIFLQQLRSY